MRDMKYRLAVLFFIAINQLTFAQEFSITANITGFPNGTKFYLDEIHSQQTIAEAALQHDKVIIKGSFTEYPTMVVLKATLNNNAYAYFILMGNENVFVNGDIRDFPFDIKVSGSRYQDENEMLKKQTRQYDKLRDSISENLFELIKDTSAAGKGKISSIAKQQNYYDRITDSITVNFIKTHLNTYAAINQLYYLRKKFSKDSLEIMYNSLGDELKESIFGRRLFTFLKIDKVLKVGDEASDFEAQDAKGNKHKLSDLHGKLVLLDFTETYCVPCIRAIEELKMVSEKYAGRLTIVSFCADKQKDTWLKGIKRDTPGWLCLWDGKGPASETPLKYGVSGYPTFVLVSTEGKILSRFSGYGKDDILKEISKQVIVNKL
jgi:thiol-disulfide isomerase/thioredoxin